MKKVVFAVLLVCFGVVGCSVSSSPESIIREHYDAMSDGDIERALKHFREIEREQWATKLTAALSKRSEHVRSCGGVKEVKIEGEKVTDLMWRGKAHVTYKSADPKCKPKTERWRFILYEGKWYIPIG